MNPQVGHDILGSRERAQMMQLSQVQIAQIVSRAVSQELSQHIQQTASNPTLAPDQAPLPYNGYNHPSGSMYLYSSLTVQHLG